MKRKALIAIGCIVIVLLGVVLGISMSPTKKLSKISSTHVNKPVVLIVIDSLMTKPLQEIIKEGEAPAFSFLIENGNFYPEIISSYPTMSVTIDSTLLTGTYSDQHKIPGLIWFNEDERRMVSYGSGIREIWDNGVKNVATDSVIYLNEDHLSKNVRTIYEELENMNIQSASINGLLYRGSISHKLNVPSLISFIDLLPRDIDVSAPDILSLGALSQYNPKNDWNKVSWKRMGVNNDFTVNELTYLLEQKKLPSFTLAYLPDADASIHKNGPNDTSGIQKADQSLQKLLNSFDSWEKAVQEVTWIILGDSGQSFVKEEKHEALIDLNDLLKEYTFFQKGQKNAQLALGVNERMAYVYLMDEKINVPDIVGILQKDERIGFIAWRDKQTHYVRSSQSKEDFTFSPVGPYIDEYEQTWQIDGDMSILDIKTNE